MNFQQKWWSGITLPTFKQCWKPPKKMHCLPKIHRREVSTTNNPCVFCCWSGPFFSINERFFEKQNGAWPDRLSNGLGSGGEAGALNRHKRTSVMIKNLPQTCTIDFWTWMAGQTGVPPRATYFPPRIERFNKALKMVLGGVRYG